MLPHNVSIEPFETKLEDVAIYVHSLNISVFIISEDLDTHFTGGARVRHIMEPHFYKQGRDMTGDILIRLRNQGDNFKLGATIVGIVSASSPIENSSKAVFCKLVQCLFDWLAEYFKDNPIEGEQFLMPPFLHAKDQFTDFPD